MEIKFTARSYAIDATPARWRGDVGSSPLDGASAAASSPRNDLVKSYRVHPTHCLISTQVGSLYPNRDECTDDYSWCLPVEMKDPGSISLSLPVMRAAREVLVAACGVSEKYPQGKSDAMKRAVETEESVRDFPAAGLRDVAQYVFDEAAASKLTL